MRVLRNKKLAGLSLILASLFLTNVAVADTTTIANNQEVLTLSPEQELAEEVAEISKTTGESEEKVRASLIEQQRAGELIDYAETSFPEKYAGTGFNGPGYTNRWVSFVGEVPEQVVDLAKKLGIDIEFLGAAPISLKAALKIQERVGVKIGSDPSFEFGGLEVVQNQRTGISLKVLSAASYPEIASMRKRLEKILNGMPISFESGIIRLEHVPIPKPDSDN